MLTAFWGLNSVHWSGIGLAESGVKNLENFKNWQVHIHGLLDTSPLKFIGRRAIICLRDMLGTTTVEEDAQCKGASEL